MKIESASYVKDIDLLEDNTAALIKYPSEEKEVYSENPREDILRYLKENKHINLSFQITKRIENNNIYIYVIPLVESG